MKRILCFVLALALVFSLSVTAFAEEPETLAEDNTMLNFCVDVTKDNKYYDAVLWAYLSGITGGTDNVHFSPDAAVTRAQAVTFLWNLAGNPVVDYFMQMSDVPSGKYYTEAVRWALSMGITKGTSKTTFSPDKECTVGEMITLLWRFSGSPVVNYAMDMSDVPSGAFYTEAIRWALSLGIAHGAADHTFGPGKVCTREKTVSSLYRFCTLISAAAKAASTGEDAVVRLDSESPAVLISNVADKSNDLDLTFAIIIDELAELADKTSTPTGDPIGPGEAVRAMPHRSPAEAGIANDALQGGTVRFIVVVGETGEAKSAALENGVPNNTPALAAAWAQGVLVIVSTEIAAQDEITLDPSLTGPGQIVQQIEPLPGPGENPASKNS